MEKKEFEMMKREYVSPGRVRKKEEGVTGWKGVAPFGESIDS